MTQGMVRVGPDTILPDVTYAKAWGTLAKQAKIIPADLNEFQAAAIVQTGRELGLQPLQSLRNMSFINGRITVSVQLQLALARQGGVKCPKDWLKEKVDYCSATLERGTEVVTCVYTMDDAKKAGLVRAGGAYDKYARQMLRWRAIGDALRLIAPDLVMGLLSPEEAASIEPLEAKEAVPFPEPEAGKQVGPDYAAGRTDQEAVPAGARRDPVDAPVVPEGVHAKEVSVSEAIREGLKRMEEDKAAAIKPTPHKKGMPGFLQAMAQIKEVMNRIQGSDIAYYNVLQSFGLKHANEAKDMQTMKAIYKAAKVRTQEMIVRQADEDMGQAVGDE